jgi:hypothetical protein
MPPSKCVDVALQVYGKPYQTAITLLSLLRQSEQWIDTIYFVTERRQPPKTCFRFLRKLLEPYKVVYHTPLFYLQWFNMTTSAGLHFLPFGPFRRSIRYQYAWERSESPYLLVLHNDVLFTDDLVGAYLRTINNHVGIGKVGQCWNCPAFKDDKCSGDRYAAYQPSFEEVGILYGKYGNLRDTPFTQAISPGAAWPLPECRLNEYASMFNMAVARPVTMPLGKAHPVGMFGPIDIGTAWFQEVNRMGLRVANFDYDPYASHAWASGINNGHRALANRELYDREEQQAYDMLREQFGLSEDDLC